ncbi:MAG: heavy metal translocating P-type ATPase [Deinococcales bacterium]
MISSLASPRVGLNLKTVLENPLYQGIALTVLTLLGLLLGLLGRGMGVAWLEWLGYALSFAAGGVPAAREAIHTLLTERKLDVDLLMVVAALGAASVGAPEDGAILLFLFSLSNTLQDWAMARTSSAIQALMKLNPTTATVLEAGVERVVHIEDICPGQLLLVRPGERFAADGVVRFGSSSVDESAITGESVPIDKTVGDLVRSGTLNDTGALQVEVQRSAGESTLAQLIRLVEGAQAAKSPTEQFAAKLEGPYTVAVLLSVPVVFALARFGFSLETGQAWYRAMSFLVAASPCAVVIATPAAVLSAMAAGARHGVLFKSGAALESLSSSKILCFDKTGTLTQGRMRLVQLISLAGTDENNLCLAASLESHSEHPVAKAVVQAFAAQKLDLLEPRAVKGKGLVATLASPTDIKDFGDAQVWIGNRALAIDFAVTDVPALEARLHTLEQQGYTTMILGVGTRALALLAVADTKRDNAHRAIAALHRLKLRLVMLTGDRQVVAEGIAKELGIDEVRGQLLPEEKLATIADLQRHGKVAMVGDGINDAPALVAADVGISMGSGSDVALESADVVLMRNDLSKLTGAIALARDTQRTVRFNLFFALGVIVIAGTLTVLGRLPLPLAVIAHEGGTVFVCLVGLRLLLHRVS